MSSLSQVREHITNLCINILHAYRKYCATVSSSGQLILPEALKLLPLYTLGMILYIKDIMLHCVLGDSPWPFIMLYANDLVYMLPEI